MKPKADSLKKNQIHKPVIDTGWGDSWMCNPFPLSLGGNCGLYLTNKTIANAHIQYPSPALWMRELRAENKRTSQSHPLAQCKGVGFVHIEASEWK